MPIQTTCSVAAIEKLNPYAYSMTLDIGPMAREALPGQFVHIKCGHSRLLRRPISICAVDGDAMRLVFEVRGEGTEWLAQRKAGDTLDVLGPLGHGFDISGDKLLMVGGGIGLPPLLYCAKAAEGEVHVVAGFRSKDRSMLAADFEKSAKTFSIASDDGTVGYHGYVDALVREKLKEGGFTSVLSCGPKPMLKSVVKAAGEFGVSVQVSMEERMGCGVGACLVCACKSADGHMKHVCKDGPVFDAEEVSWDD